MTKFWHQSRKDINFGLVEVTPQSVFCLYFLAQRPHVWQKRTLLISVPNLLTFASFFMAAHASGLTCRLNPHWRQCPCHAPFRSIPAAENVPRGSWLLDDHVLQHHPLPLHLLTHLQPVPADGWEHEVRHSISLPPPSFPPHVSPPTPHSVLHIC